MDHDDLFTRLTRDLALAGEEDAAQLIEEWFDRGQATAGLSTPAPPEPVQEIEAAGPPEAAVYTRAGELQTLWLVITGATAECEEARAAGNQAQVARLRKLLTMLTALSEEETASVNTALKAQTN